MVKYGTLVLLKNKNMLLVSAVYLSLSKGKKQKTTAKFLPLPHPKQLNHSHIQPPRIPPKTVHAGFAFW